MAARDEIPLAGVPTGGFPARDIGIPEGSVLTDEEIVAVLKLANERKAEGNPGFDLVASIDPEFFTLKVPTKIALQREEVIVCLTRLNEACAYGSADVLFTFDQGRMVKRGWVTLKDPRGRETSSGLSLRGAKTPKEF